jgi:hypothetical protein
MPRRKKLGRRDGQSSLMDETAKKEASLKPERVLSCGL